MLFGRSKTGLTSDHPYSDCPLFLVSGMGRSGTTALRNCVANHPDVLCLNRESNYIFHLMRGASRHTDDEFSLKNLVVNKSEFWALHRQFILSLLWPTPSLGDDVPKAIATYSNLGPRAAIGLTATFPKLSICYIVRNGIEVVSSYRAFDNFKHMSFEEVCRNWQFHSRLNDYVKRQRHCTLIRYEWIQESMVDFVAAITKAFQRIGLKFDDACLTALEQQFHPTVYTGESEADANDLAKRKDRWIHWSEQERKVFTELCGETMKSLGYSIPW